MTSGMGFQSDREDRMPTLLPIRRAVVEIFGDAHEGDEQAIRRAVKSLYNKKAAGTLPDSLFCRVGGALYLNVPQFKQFLEDQSTARTPQRPGPGRPRTR